MPAETPGLVDVAFLTGPGGLSITQQVSCAMICVLYPGNKVPPGGVPTAKGDCNRTLTAADVVRGLPEQG